VTAVSDVHTVAIDGLRATAGALTMGWGVYCQSDEGCSIVGFRNEAAAIRGAANHLIWHLNGKPTCGDCGAWLPYKSSRCRKGTCEATR
jgi:ribosomal protein L40E